MKNTDIKKVYIGGEEVSALYLGGTSIYQKEEEKPRNVLAGSFTTQGNYTYKYNGSQSVSIPLKTDNTFEMTVENLTTCKSMFYFSYALKSIDSLPDTSNVISMNKMFQSCGSLISIHFNNNVHNVADFGYIFTNCTNLKTISGNISGISANISISDSFITNNSAMVFINGLAEVTSTKTLTFRATTFETLTDEQIALATSKGWSVVSA